MNARWIWIGLGLALLVALLSPLASSHPDGLERVAEDKGFLEKAQDAWYRLIPDYVFPGVENESLATILAGVVGTLIMFGLVFGLGRLLARRSTS
ncbi:MAG: PDGLE domain-containing protein [Chloroflexi bacterium]|nr:PDGLE domain-containing protein [Chloroflexota bacterium]